MAANSVFLENTLLACTASLKELQDYVAEDKRLNDLFAMQTAAKKQK